jgi:hypothetical protein
MYPAERASTLVRPDPVFRPCGTAGIYAAVEPAAARAKRDLLLRDDHGVRQVKGHELFFGANGVALPFKHMKQWWRPVVTLIEHAGGGRRRWVLCVPLAGPPAGQPGG